MIDITDQKNHKKHDQNDVYIELLKIICKEGKNNVTINYLKEKIIWKIFDCKSPFEFHYEKANKNDIYGLFHEVCTNLLKEEDFVNNIIHDNQSYVQKRLKDELKRRAFDIFLTGREKNLYRKTTNAIKTLSYYKDSATKLIKEHIGITYNQEPDCKENEKKEILALCNDWKVKTKFKPTITEKDQKGEKEKDAIFIKQKEVDHLLEFVISKKKKVQFFNFLECLKELIGSENFLIVKNTPDAHSNKGKKNNIACQIPPPELIIIQESQFDLNIIIIFIKGVKKERDLLIYVINFKIILPDNNTFSRADVVKIMDIPRQTFEDSLQRTNERIKNFIEKHLKKNGISFQDKDFFDFNEILIRKLEELYSKDIVNIELKLKEDM